MQDKQEVGKAALTFEDVRLRLGLGYKTAGLHAEECAPCCLHAVLARLLCA